MGYSRFDPDSWTTYAASTATKSRSAIFTKHSIDDSLDPKKFLMRESRDSIANPLATPIIIGVDVTGSMGMIAENLVKKGIGTVFSEILERAKDPKSGMVPDPQMMVIAIGDVAYDLAPVQVTQFETDLLIAKQTETIFLEGGGGGNNQESYDVTWYTAAMRTVTDAHEKRGKKGYLFTVGDEEIPVGLTKNNIQKYFGDEAPENLSARQLLTMAEEKYHVFHVIVEQGSYAWRRGPENVKKTWQDLLGQRVLMLSDYDKLAEVIVSAIQVNEGTSIADVTASWSGDTSLAVARAIGDLAKSTSGVSSGIVRF